MSTVVITPQVHKKGDPRTPIPPRVMALSAMELQLGVFRFLPTTHAKTKQMQTKCTRAFHSCVS